MPRPSRSKVRSRGAKRSVLVRWRPVLLVVGLAAVAGVAVLATGTGGSDNGNASTSLPLRTQAPWPPTTDRLRERVEEAGFPPVGDESFHVHALLSVYIDGAKVTVPANIGIDAGRRFMSPLHTHTPDGVIHFEADEPAPFTLHQVFAIWGVDLANDRIGAYTTRGPKQLHVYVNGRRPADPLSYEIADGDNIVVAYGEAGSFPTQPRDDALRNA